MLILRMNATSKNCYPCRRIKTPSTKKGFSLVSIFLFHEPSSPGFQNYTMLKQNVKFF